MNTKMMSYYSNVLLQPNDYAITTTMCRNNSNKRRKMLTPDGTPLLTNKRRRQEYNSQEDCPVDKISVIADEWMLWCLERCVRDETNNMINHHLEDTKYSLAAKGAIITKDDNDVQQHDTPAALSSQDQDDIVALLEDEEPEPLSLDWSSPSLVGTDLIVHHQGNSSSDVSTITAPSEFYQHNQEECFAWEQLLEDDDLEQQYHEQCHQQLVDGSPHYLFTQPQDQSTRPSQAAAAVISVSPADPVTIQEMSSDILTLEGELQSLIEGDDLLDFLSVN